MSLPASGGTMEGSGGNGGSEEKKGEETGAGAEASGEHGGPGEKDNKGKGIMEEIDSGKISPTKGKPEPERDEIKITQVYILLTLKEILDRKIDLQNWQKTRDMIHDVRKKIFVSSQSLKEGGRAFEYIYPGDYEEEDTFEDEVGMVIKETVDRILPITTVGKKVKWNFIITDEDRKTVQKCVSQFLSAMTSMAIMKCHEKNREKITFEDLCDGLSYLGFYDYKVKMYLENYGNSTEMEKDDENKADSSRSSAMSLMPDAGENKKKELEEIAAALDLMDLEDEYYDIDREIREHDRLVLMVKNNSHMFGVDVLEGLMSQSHLFPEDVPNYGSTSEDDYHDDDDIDDYYNDDIDDGEKSGYDGEESGDDGKC